jgi:MG2 domain
VSELLSRLLGLTAGSEGDVQVVRVWLRFADNWPLWALLASFAAIIVIAWWAYRPTEAGPLEPPRPGAPEGRGLPRGKRWTMAVLRATALLLALLILLQPLAAFERTLGVKPRLAVLLDDSQSMTIADKRIRPEEQLGAARAMGLARYGRGGVSAAVGDRVREVSRGDLLAAALRNKQLDLEARLGKHYDLRFFTFGQKGRAAGARSASAAVSGLEYKDSFTDMGAGLRAALADLRGQPAAGAIVLSDGGSNRGEPAAEAAAAFKREGLPVFTVGIGLPQARDLQMTAFICEDVVFLRDSVPVYARVRQRGYAGERVSIELKKGEKVLARKNVTLLEDQELTVALRFKPDVKGEAVYRLSVETRPDELILENNFKEKRIKVIDEAIKVLAVEQAPRWDFRFLKGTLLRDKRVKYTCYVREADGRDLARSGMPHYLTRFPNKREELFKYDMIILGDVSAKSFSKEQLKLIEEFVAQGGGGLCFAAGSRYNPASYKKTVLEPLVPVVFAPQPEALPEAELFVPLVQPYRLEITREGLGHEVCRLRESRAANAALWRRLPLHYWHFPATRLRPAAVALAVHGEAKNAFGKTPLIAYQYYGRGKTFYVGFDSTWRWRHKVGSRYFARFWGQTINFLSLAHLLGESKRVQISTDRKLYAAGDEVKLSARVLDKSFRAVKDKKVRAAIARAEGEPVEVELLAVPGQPGMFAGEWLASETGDYSVNVKGEEAEGRADFAVRMPQLEFDHPAMDRETLAVVAECSGGKFFRLEDLDKLAAAISTSRPLVTEEDESPLWDRWGMLILLVLVLGAEWLIRKRSDLA